MEAICAAMRERSDRVGQLKRRTLELEARGRDFRATIGRAMDALGSELSTKARERDAVAAEREQLEQRRDALLSRGPGGGPAAVGEADAVLWQIAATDEVLRAAIAACEDLEYQLRELSNQLTRLSDALESDQSGLSSSIDEALRHLARDDGELRALAASLPG
jgi:hypothetical protein